VNDTDAIVNLLEGRQTFGHYLLNTDNTVKFFCFDIDVNKTGQWVDDLGSTVDINPREAIVDESHPARKWLIHQVRCMAEGLSYVVEKKLGVQSSIVWSGAKGAHVYGLTGRTPAAEARAAARWLLEDFACFELIRGDHFWRHFFHDDPMHGYPHLTLEVYPKQDTLDDKDLGNLLRVPLGVNRKTNKESFFMDTKAPAGTLAALDPLTALDGRLWES
jgi:hypothetical protein